MPSTDRAGREQEDLEPDATWGEGSPPDPGETPRDVVLALGEDSRQAAQDVVYGRHGERWPSLRAQEAAALERAHARCAAWVARYEAAVARTAQRSG
jgi:hypothetical protein